MKKGNSNPFKPLVDGFKTLEKGARRFAEVANKFDEDDEEETAFDLMQKQEMRKTGAIPKQRFQNSCEPADPADPTEEGSDSLKNKGLIAAQKKRMELKARKQAATAKRNATLQAKKQAQAGISAAILTI